MPTDARRCSYTCYTYPGVGGKARPMVRGQSNLGAKATQAIFFIVVLRHTSQAMRMASIGACQKCDVQVTIPTMINICRVAGGGFEVGVSARAFWWLEGLGDVLWNAAEASRLGSVGYGPGSLAAESRWCRSSPQPKNLPGVPSPEQEKLRR